MREILFRGKQNEGRWVEGVYFKHDTVKVCFSSDDPKPRHLIIQDGFCDWGFEPPINCVDVDPETVGQFTGLTDKNGKKIFEGDIIHAHYANAPKADFVEQVVFCDGRFCSLFFTISGSGKMWSALPLSAPHIKTDKTVYMEWCEVIGNIHDNPELLEVTDNENS